MNRDSAHHIASLIEAFLNGTIGLHEWDDFVSIRQEDPALDEIRRECDALPLKFPPDLPDHYCGPEGTRRLEEIAALLRQGKQ